MDKHRGIGYKGGLLTYLPGDLPRFKEITYGHTVIMGRKTFESLPHGPLKGRTNIVITRNKDLKIDGVVICYSLNEAIEKVVKNDEAFIIGGGEIYNEAINLVDKLYITEIAKEYEADTYFPLLGSEWSLVDSINNDTDPNLVFSYNTYIKEYK